MEALAFIQLYTTDIDILFMGDFGIKCTKPTHSFESANKIAKILRSWFGNGNAMYPEAMQLFSYILWTVMGGPRPPKWHIFEFIVLFTSFMFIWLTDYSVFYLILSKDFVNKNQEWISQETDSRIYITHLKEWF